MGRRQSALSRNASVEWPEAQAPFHGVARLTLLPKSRLGQDVSESLYFDVTGHSLPDSTPLGSINRARWPGEMASRKARMGFGGLSRKLRQRVGIFRHVREGAGGGKSYLERKARISTISSTTRARSCAFSASSRSSSLGLLRLEICLSEAPFACRARSRATCRLSTFFALFDREISFMINPRYPHRPARSINSWILTQLLTASS
jgi:hypothetical protein